MDSVSIFWIWRNGKNFHWDRSTLAEWNFSTGNSLEFPLGGKILLFGSTVEAAKLKGLFLLISSLSSLNLFLYLHIVVQTRISNVGSTRQIKRYVNHKFPNFQYYLFLKFKMRLFSNYGNCLIEKPRVFTTLSPSWRSFPHAQNKWKPEYYCLVKFERHHKPATFFVTNNATDIAEKELFLLLFTHSPKNNPSILLIKKLTLKN